MLLQKDTFTEDTTQDTESIIRKYFPNTVVLSDKEIYNLKRQNVSYASPFRGTLFLGQQLGYDFEWSNALRWMPTLHKWIITDSYIFMDMESISRRQLSLKWPLFIRPCSGTKAFSGNVFASTDWYKEYTFATKNRNIDPNLTCVVSEPVKIYEEYRMIFIDNQFVSGCRYMKGGEIDLDKNYPDEARQVAEKVASHDYFVNRFNFVIDVAKLSNRFALIEINALETASFYACDLHKIYSTWAASLK